MTDEIILDLDAEKLRTDELYERAKQQYIDANKELVHDLTVGLRRKQMSMIAEGFTVLTAQISDQPVLHHIVKSFWGKRACISRKGRDMSVDSYAEPYVLCVTAFERD